MRLNPSNFNAFLTRIGQRFAWRRATFCPCRNARSGSPDPGCAHCRGLGYAWDEAVQGAAGIAGQKVQREWAQFGMWESGDMVLTLPSNSALYDMGENDRVTMLDSSMPFTTQLEPNAVKLRWPIASVAAAYYLDSQCARVDLALPDVDDDGVTLIWPETPPAGKAISLTGRQRQEYFCFGAFPQDRAHHQGAALPRRVVVRRFELMGRR